MLKKRVIPNLLWRSSGLVKGTKFDNWRNVCPVLPALRLFEKRDVDELIIIDLDASENARDIPFLELQRVARELSCPLTYGGGITSLSQVEKILRSGFDRVLITSSGFENKNIFIDIVDEFGSQALVTSIDARKTANGFYELYSRCGKKRQHNSLLDWLKVIDNSGVGEIIVNNIDRCGTYLGYDLELTKIVCEASNISVVASAGAGSCQHILNAFEQTRINGAAVGSLFHFTNTTPGSIRNFLSGNSVNVRETRSVITRSLMSE